MDGKLELNEVAWIVKEILDRFVAVESMWGIAKSMNEKGGWTRGGEFALQSVCIILKNETCACDKHLQRTPPMDYITHRPVPTAKYQDCYLTNDHTPIIERSMWERTRVRAPMTHTATVSTTFSTGRSPAENVVLLLAPDDYDEKRRSR